MPGEYGEAAIPHYLERRFGSVRRGADSRRQRTSPRRPRRRAMIAGAGWPRVVSAQNAGNGRLAHQIALPS
jgi:hypothetical protein